MAIQKPKKAVETEVNTGLWARGAHIARIVATEKVGETTLPDGSISPRGQVVTWRDKKNGWEYTEKLSNGKIPYFMNGLNRQFNWEMTGWTFGEVIAYCMDNDIELFVDITPQYGMQLGYFKPEK